MKAMDEDTSVTCLCRSDRKAAVSYLRATTLAPSPSCVGQPVSPLHEVGANFFPKKKRKLPCRAASSPPTASRRSCRGAQPTRGPRAARLAARRALRARPAGEPVQALRDRAVQAYLARAASAARARARTRMHAVPRLLRNLVKLDRDAARDLPGVLEELRQYRIRRGDVQANVRRLVESIEQLDDQGRTAIHMWLTRDAAYPHGGGALLTRVVKDWSRISQSGKEQVLKQVKGAQLMVDAPAVQLRPVDATECSNLRFHVHDDWFDMVMQDDVLPHTLFVQATGEDGTSACTPAELVHDMAFDHHGNLVDPLDIMTHWNRSLTPETRATIAKFVSRRVGDVDIPVLRAWRVARAMDM